MTRLRGSDGFCITCKCGHTDEWDAFEKSKSGIDVDAGTLQCPSCSVAWTLVTKGKGRLFDDGFYIPPQREVVEVNAIL